MERTKIDKIIRLVTFPLFVFILCIFFWFYYQYSNKGYQLVRPSLVENITKIKFNLYNETNPKEMLANITISRENDNVWRIVEINQNSELNEVSKCENYPVSTAYIDIFKHLLNDIKVNKTSVVQADENRSLDTIASITLIDNQTNKSQQIDVLSIVGSHYTEIMVKSLEHIIYTDAQLYDMIPTSCVDVASTQIFFAQNFSLNTLTSLNVDFNQFQFSIEHNVTNPSVWLVNGKNVEFTPDLEKAIHWFYPILANQLITFDAENFTETKKIGTIEIKSLNETYNIDIKQDNNSTYLIYNNKVFTIDEFIFNEVQTAIKSE